MSPAEFEPAISASERPQTNALYRATTGIGVCVTIGLRERVNYLINGREQKFKQLAADMSVELMFIGPCIILIVE